MRGRGGVTAPSNRLRQLAWREPISTSGGQLKHARFVWIKRGGVGRTSGSTPSGCKATPKALLSRALRERAGVAEFVTKRQAERVAAKANPPVVIYGPV